MKIILLIFLIHLSATSFLQGQQFQLSDKQRKDIHALIDKYSEAREKSDTLLLKSILTDEIDQLVSTGEWRNGIDASMKGMQRSSANTTGTRTLTIEKIRLLNPHSAIVDCKYEIKNTDGTTRKMWSTFIVVSDKRIWKISAIRNMLPAGSQ
jgi:ketosteroid isomerase-like protein